MKPRFPVYTVRNGAIEPFSRERFPYPSLACPKCGKTFAVRSGGRFNHIRACKGQP